MNNYDETIPATIERLLAKQRDDDHDPTPPTAPAGQAMPLGGVYSPLERSFGY